MTKYFKVSAERMRTICGIEEAPECVCVLHDAPVESNAAVMDRALNVVRDNRLTREYLAAHDGEASALDAGISDNEQVRALAAEQSRADHARVLTSNAAYIAMSRTEAIAILNDAPEDAAFFAHVRVDAIMTGGRHSECFRAGVPLARQDAILFVSDSFSEHMARIGAGMRIALKSVNGKPVVWIG